MHMITLNKNKYFLLSAFPMLNLLFMHYFFYLDGLLEWTWAYSELINLCSVVFDVSVLLIFFLLIFVGRLKLALVLTQMVTLIWSFVNVMYGKFFAQYMSLSAINEVHSLGDELVINSVMSGFYWYDLYFLISGIGFVIIYINLEPIRFQLIEVLKFVIIPVSSIIMTIVAYSVFHFVHPHYRNNWELFKFRTIEFLYDPVRGGTPNLAHFHTSSIRIAFYELYDIFHITDLTMEEKKQIESYYTDYSLRYTSHKRDQEVKNVIFILLESFLSSPIDLKVDGKEITPFLNSLKEEHDVYYNGNMISDITCGESGDGQFIYMTGLLPLRYKMTVGSVKNNVLPALPIVLKGSLGINYSEIISPTHPNLWQQSEMNKAYGIDNAYWLEDIVGNQSRPIDDNLIFKFASERLPSLKEPFFLLLLSLSTHSPYNRFFGQDILNTNNSIGYEYRNYLNSCHYLDEQLSAYFKSLKDNGLYENSLIIIGADHYAHLDMLNMIGKISNHTPLFIIHGGIDNEAWQGEFHQLDTYTTLLDLLGINTQWKGLGHTILSPLYKKSVDITAFKFSDLIIESNYFAR